MDIPAWLRGLGLEQYEAAFRENDIDAEILPDLTPEDLAALGVASVGHRRKLLAAIAALARARHRQQTRPHRRRSPAMHRHPLSRPPATPNGAS
jgi:SAM domain (Sterile alpha motif)